MLVSGRVTQPKNQQADRKKQHTCRPVFDPTLYPNNIWHLQNSTPQTNRPWNHYEIWRPTWEVYVYPTGNLTSIDPESHWCLEDAKFLFQNGPPFQVVGHSFHFFGGKETRKLQTSKSEKMFFFASWTQRTEKSILGLKKDGFLSFANKNAPKLTVNFTFSIRNKQPFWNQTLRLGSHFFSPKKKKIPPGFNSVTLEFPQPRWWV